MELKPRLAACARLCSDGKNIADIGTDHGYIPLWLVKNGHGGRIAASDIGDGPLMSAKRTAAEENAEDRIEFYLADGLSGLDGGFDTFVIAGMGGDTIIHILSSSPFTLEDKVLVLQPQSKLERLIPWLFSSGFQIDEAVLAKEGGRLYTVFRVSWSGVRRKADFAESFALAALKGDPLYGEYREKIAFKLKASLSGLRKSSQPDEKAAEELEAALREVEECF